MAPASRLRLPYIAFRAIYEPQFEADIGTEGDGYDSEELDEKHLHAAVNLYKEYKRSKNILTCSVGNATLLTEEQPEAIANGVDTVEV
jgi:hypothetical protein